MKMVDGGWEDAGRSYELVSFAPQGASTSDDGGSHRPGGCERRARAAGMRELQGRTCAKTGRATDQGKRA